MGLAFDHCQEEKLTDPPLKWSQDKEEMAGIVCSVTLDVVFLAVTTVSHLVGLPSIPALEIPAQCFPPTFQ